MCGRATSLFVAANLGWDAAGADVDRADPDQAEKYFKRYLEYHRVKHGVERLSRTLKQGGSAPQCRFEYAPPGRVREQMAEAGPEVLSGGVYDGFSHWVKQAITRDIAVGRKSAG